MTQALLSIGIPKIITQKYTQITLYCVVDMYEDVILPMLYWITIVKLLIKDVVRGDMGTHQWQSALLVGLLVCNLH